MNRPIHNREFNFDPAAPIEVLRMGVFKHSSGINQEVDEEAMGSIVTHFARDKQSPNFPGLLVDFDHFSADMDKPSEAAGWITDLQRSGSSLMAKVDWSAAGEEAVRSGRYRLLSPVFNRQEMQDLGNSRMRPLRLDSAGLTNAPNMKGLTPISNRSTETDVETLSAQQAGQRFSVVVNRVRTENGWTFDQAWNHCRATEQLLFNRMAAQPEPTTARPSRPSKGGQEFCKYASDTLYELAQQEQQAHGSSFAEAWPRVCNRHAVLNRLANRETSSAVWEEMDRTAREKFTADFQHGPDGKRIVILPDKDEQGRTNSNSTRKCFTRCWDMISGKESNLKPDEIWARMREEYPHVFWPFVAMLNLD